MKNMKITVVSYIMTQEEEDYKHKAKFYIVNCLGDLVYMHTHDKAKAVAYVKEEYQGKYSVRMASIVGGSGEVTVRSTVNNKSRAGAYHKQIESNQGKCLQ